MTKVKIDISPMEITICVCICLVVAGWVFGYIDTQTFVHVMVTSAIHTVLLAIGIGGVVVMFFVVSESCYFDRDDWILLGLSVLGITVSVSGFLYGFGIIP